MIQSSRVVWGHVLFFTVSSILLASSARAVGLGPYFEYGHSIGSQDFGSTVEYDANRFGVGFALDTAVARDRLFNYRLNLGYQHSKREYDSIFVSETLNGILLNNMFGFGIIRNENMRLWLGPSLRLSADILSGTPSNVDVVDLSAGGGFALGVNVHTGRTGSAAFTFGYQYLYVGEVFSVNGGASSNTADGREHLITLNLTYYFRLGADHFEVRRAP